MLKTMLKTRPIRFNRIIAMLLSLIMLCGILPFGALPLDVFADDVIDYEISICGISITSNNIDRFESAENNRYGVAFDKSGNTLYLSAPDAMSVTNVDFISYFGKGTLTVVVLEDIRIECRGDSGFLHATKGSVVFSAASKGRLSITNGSTTAIKADKLTVEGGTIFMELPESGVYANTAVEANVISVNGGGLEVYGVPRGSQDLSDFYNTGIVYNKEMTVSGGSVVVSDYAHGIVASDGNAVLNIKGGAVEVDAFRTGVQDVSLCHTAGWLHAQGDKHGIYAAAIQVSGTAKLIAANKGTHTGESYPVYAQGVLEVDTDVFFISAPKGGYVKDHPYGGKIIIDPYDHQPASGVVWIMPRVSCFVRRNDGPEEEYPLTYSPDNSGKFDLFQVRVGDKIVVRLVANDGQLLNLGPLNGSLSVAQKDFLKTQRSEDQKQLTFTFEPTYLPEAAWTYNDESRMWENKYNTDESKAGCSVTLSPTGGNASAYKFSWLTFEALLGKTVWEEAKAQVTIPRGETLRVRVPLKTYDGRDIAVSKEEFDYKLIKYIIYISQDSHSITHDGDSSVIVELKVADNARLGDGGNTKNEAVWEFFFSNSYEEVRFSLVATVVECWCDMGERLIERPVSEAACTVGGCAVKHWECSKCGKLFADAAGETPITDPQTVLTPAKGHKWVEKVDAGYLKSAADCENPAVYYKSCEYCGLSSKELYDLRAAAANFVPGSAETVTIDGVEFYILAVDDGKALLLTKETVAAGIAFDSDSPKWSESDIRAWLNGEWLAGKTRLAALLEPADIYTAAAYNDQKKTVASRDKVFLLSEADVTGEHDRKAVTNNALYTYNGAKLTAPGEGWGIDGRHWWLRSPCSAGIYVSAVTDRGMAHSYPHDLTVHYVQPRPAMWVRFDDPDPTPEWQYKIGKIKPGSADTVTIDGVEFHVLAKDAAKGEALLLTKNVLDDNRAFGGPGAEWVFSDLRTWLNGEWLEGMPVLKNFVNETKITTSDSTTLDKVFLLTKGDVFGDGGIEYTYNKAKLPAPGGSWIAYDQGGLESGWWLRSVYINNSDNMCVVEPDNANLLPLSSVMPAGVRPAVWVPYKEPEWQEKIESITPGDADTVTIDGVEFHVLAKDAAKGRALLLTKDVLFNKDKELVFDYYNNPSWADSLLRDFMNGTHAETPGGSRFFYPHHAPTLAQYAQKTEIYTPAGYDRTEFVTTQDAFFLLSEADVFGTQNGVAVTDPRYYTYKGKLPAPGGSWVAADGDGKPRYWWLRSPRYNQYSVAQVLYDGTLNSINPNADDNDGVRGVRPAVWIQYKEPLPEPETFKDGSALGHDWGAASYDWSYTSNGTPSGCTAAHTCTLCGHTETEEGTITSEQTTPSTCTAQGEMTYTATFTKTGFVKQTTTSPIDPLGGEHEWLEEGWTWYYPDIGNRIIADGAFPDYPAVTLKLKCSKCGDGVSVTVPKAELQLLVEGDVCNGGTKSFIAVVDYEDGTYSKQDTFATINAEGHLFGPPVYTWGPGNSTCTAQRTCTRDNCNHGEFGTADATSEQTKDPTCTEEGLITYTARFTNPAFATQYKYVGVAMLEHDWGQTVDAKYLKSAATCTSPAVYFQSCKTCGERHDSETFENGNALGHSFGKPAYSWAALRGGEQRTCTAERVCTRCGENDTETATVTPVKTKDPTCTKKGQYTYTATFKNTAFETQKSYSDIAELGHEWVDKAEDEYLKTAADCTNAAVYYKSCSRCDEKHNSETFKNGNPRGHKWVNMVDVKYLESAADCEHPAVYHQSCEHCNIKHDTDTFNNGDPLGHDYGDWYVVVKATDRQKGLKRHDCTRDGCDHFETSETDMVEYKLELEESDGGKTTVEPADPQSGDGVKITVEPEEDKRVKEITVTDGDGNQIEITDNGNGEYEFTMPEGDVKIVVEYEPKPAATVDENEGGKTKLEPEYPDAGDEVKITVEPEEDKRVKEITVTDGDGNVIEITDNGDGEYIFIMPDSDVTIEVVYEPKPVVSVEENEGGNTVIGPKHPDTGDEVDFTVTPEEDQRVKEIRVIDKDGNVIDVTDKGNGGYVFIMPDSDVTIEVIYEPKPVVSVDENEGGKTVVGPKHPDTGDEVDFTVTPEDGKKIKEITVTDKEGNKIDVTDKGNGGYVFTMPDSDVTIEVVYESIVKPSPEIPPTGDNSKLLLWLMLMCISGIGVIATSLKGKKRKHNS